MQDMDVELKEFLASEGVPDTWDIIDGSKLSTYMRCPRLYFWQYVVGWNYSDNQTLHFGQAFHFALEHLYKRAMEVGRVEYQKEWIEEAKQSFMAHYRKRFAPDTDDDFAPRNPHNALIALDQYCEKYKHADMEFSVLHAEVSGMASLGYTLDGGDRKLFFRIDTIVEDSAGVAILEHKTSGWGEKLWATDKRIAIQTGMGCHVLHCYVQDKTVNGIIYNGVFLRKEPRLKKDGTPYAGSTGNEFLRVPISMRHDQLQSWIYDMNFWMDLLELDMLRLKQVKADASTMNCFARSGDCTKYNKACPYIDYCEFWSNPMNKVFNGPQEPFVLSQWNPQDVEGAGVEHVKLGLVTEGEADE